ncbi:CAAX prenyl protease-related protein [Candidatus Moduliflexus flocculans]|uniref:CAAX prenyl protease-related protein n=1 Tax=Candidatus Moduliflexus flocculans TaxID=1499966 RepID=A0A0S6VYU7_9BACT|nr:CAAX prenyl protease-related protein [Candidatus Moduliflexus flocculans]
MKKSFLPYLVPFAAFLILTYVGAYSGQHGVYIFYAIKTLVVGGLLYYYYSRGSYPELQWKCSWIAILVGILVFIIWVAPDEASRRFGGDWLRFIKLGKDDQFTPYQYGVGMLAWLIIAVRLIGAVIVVPVFEELFWRSFALRWLINDDFLSVPVGAFTWLSFAIVTLGFGFEHHEWLVGLLAGVLYAALLYKMKNLFDCVLAHAVTNLLLGIYVLSTQQWHLW